LRTGTGDKNIFLRILSRLGHFFSSFITNPNKRLILISAILFCLAYPPLPFGFLAYFCLIPLIIAISGKGFKAGFKAGYLFGVVQSAILLYWIGVGIRSYAAAADLEGNPFLNIFLNWIAPFGAPIAAALYLALYSAVLFGVFGWLSKGKSWTILLFPVLFTAMEYIKTLSEIAFPWIQLGYTQAMYVPMIQTASWWGDLGMGFWIAVVNLLLYFVWINRRKLKQSLIYLVIAFVLVLGAFIYGISVKYTPSGEKIKVALLQGNISLKEKFSPGSLQLTLDRHMEMANEILTDSCDLVIFAETTIREIFLRGSTRFYFSRLARNLDSYLLIGTFDRETRGERICDYNSAVQCDPQGGFDYVHHKIKLVPFSEKIPYNQYFPSINDFHFGQSDFCMGDSISIFETEKGKYAVMICFEIGFSDFNRQAVNQGADFLVTITNDTWWGVSAGPYQHAYMIPFRAVENRRWIARCANTGFSYFCDPTGKIENLGTLFEQQVITDDIYTNDTITFFGRYGQWLPKLMLLISFIFILSRFITNFVHKTGISRDVKA
jgi:apolipoprotein N-acyltransferase